MDLKKKKKKILIDDSKRIVMGLHRPLLREQQGSSHRSQRQDSAQSNVLIFVPS